MIFVQAFFWRLLTCVHHIYLINFHWSWKMSLGVIINCQWAIYKPDICIWSPREFVESCGKFVSFCDCTYCNQSIDWVQVSYSRITFFVYCWRFICKHHRRLLRLLVFCSYKHHRRFFPSLDLYIYKHNRVLLLLVGLLISVVQRGTNDHWVNTWKSFGGFLIIDL